MASIQFQLYAKFFKSLANAEIDFDSHTLKASLHTSTYTPNLTSDQYVADLSNELSTASGYTAGGATVTGVATLTVANSWSSAWASATAYTLNQVRRPTTGNTYIYRVVTAGTSAGSEPTWPTTIGLTVTDGSVVWACVGKSGLILDLTDATLWTSFSAGPYRHVVISDRTPASDAVRPLVGVYSYGSDQTGGGGNFDLTTPLEGITTIAIP